MIVAHAFHKLIAVPRYRGDDNIPYRTDLVAISGVYAVDTTTFYLGYERFRPNSAVQVFSDECKIAATIQASLSGNPICNGKSVSLQLKGIDVPSKNIHWSNGKTGIFTEVTTWGTYSATFETKDGCKGYAEIRIDSPPPLFEIVRTSHSTKKINGDTLRHRVVVVMKNLSSEEEIINNVQYILHDAFSIKADSANNNVIVNFFSGEVDSLVVQYSTMVKQRGKDSIVIRPFPSSSNRPTPCPIYIILQTSADGSGQGDSISIGGGGNTGTTAVQEMVDNVIQDIYPIPSPVHSSFRLSGSKEGSEIIVYNLMGQQVARWQVSSTEQVYDVSTLPQGIYMLVMTGVNGRQTIPLSIVR